MTKLTRTRQNPNKFLSKAIKTKRKQSEGFLETKTHLETKGKLAGTKQNREKSTRGIFFHLTGINAGAERAPVLYSAGAKKEKVRWGALSLD